MSLCGCLDTVCGTPNYMAPEVLTGEKYGLPADVWSVGCTLYEMLTAKRPFSEFAHPQAAMFHLASTGKPPALPDSIDEQASDFAEQCFARDPRDRASVEQLLLHPYVQPPLDRRPGAPQGNTALPPSAPPMEDCPATVDLRGEQEEEEGYETSDDGSLRRLDSESGAEESVEEGASEHLSAHVASPILPTCDVCRTGQAVWGCQQCTSQSDAPLQFCPTCWDRVHVDCSHRKAPLMFGRGGPAPNSRWVGTSPRNLMLSDGQLVEMLSVTDMPRPPPSSGSPVSSPSVLSPTQSQWACPKCTYLNHPLLHACEMCGSDRP